MPAVPDAFLSLGVDRLKNGETRRSYEVWEEEVVPIFVLEVVSHQLGDEYEDKMAVYEKLGVLYYVVYNQKFWLRDRHEPFEVYKLVDGRYRLQRGEPYWMPEVGLGIGRYQTTFGNIPKEILTWYDEKGTRYLSEAEWQSARADQERERADREIARRKQLEDLLREQGINPDEI